MPPPIPVELVQYDPAWAENARQEAARLTGAIGEGIITVHHIGSTAIPGIRAKPILDLMPIVRSLAEFENSRSIVEGLGYSWWGEYGLPGRRYGTLDDPQSAHRKVQLHCYKHGSSEIMRHLAFRDYLRSRPDLAHEYDALKGRCRDLHPLDSHAYTDCKDDWIRRIEAQALSAGTFANRTRECRLSLG
jgi:GrpB-like predicted nucleotidyltransferase (UPF0157 family)